jgi:hypothetical protein
MNTPSSALEKSLYGMASSKQADIRMKNCCSYSSKRIAESRLRPTLFELYKTGELQFIFLWVDVLLIAANQMECDGVIETVLNTLR